MHRRLIFVTLSMLLIMLSGSVGSAVCYSSSLDVQDSDAFTETGCSSIDLSNGTLVTDPLVGTGIAGSYDYGDGKISDGLWLIISGSDDQYDIGVSVTGTDPRISSVVFAFANGQTVTADASAADGRTSGYPFANDTRITFTVGMEGEFENSGEYSLGCVTFSAIPRNGGDSSISMASVASGNNSVTVKLTTRIADNDDADSWIESINSNSDGMLTDRSAKDSEGQPIKYHVVADTGTVKDNSGNTCPAVIITSDPDDGNIAPAGAKRRAQEFNFSFVVPKGTVFCLKAVVEGTSIGQTNELSIVVRDANGDTVVSSGKLQGGIVWTNATHYVGKIVSTRMPNTVDWLTATSDFTVEVYQGYRYQDSTISLRVIMQQETAILS